MTAHAALSRTRAWLDHNLFPVPSPPPRLTPRRVLVCCAIAAAAVLIQLARMWPSKPLNSIWAEDGHAWLADALSRGALDNLVTPFNGYLQTVSRLVAEPVALLPVEWFAAAMALSGAAIVTGCAFVVWRASAGLIENPYLRAALASMVVLLPIVGTEALDNVTNSIWFLLFAGFWILLWRPATLARALGATAVLMLATLSSGGAALLLPLWALRLIAARDRRDWVIVAGFAVALSIQIAISWGDTDLLGEAGRAQAVLSPEWNWDLVPAYAQRVVGGTITGQAITGGLWEALGPAFLVVLAAGLVGFVAWAALGSNSRARLFVPLAVAISLATFLVSGYRRWDAGGFQLLWPAGTHNDASSHYVIVPTLLLLSALFVALSREPRALSAIAWNRVRIGIVGLVVVAAVASFNVGNIAVRGAPTWSESVELGKAECARTGADKQDLTIAPAIPFRVTIVTPCSKLGAGP